MLKAKKKICNISSKGKNFPGTQISMRKISREIGGHIPFEQPLKKRKLNDMEGISTTSEPDIEAVNTDESMDISYENYCSIPHSQGGGAVTSLLQGDDETFGFGNIFDLYCKHMRITELHSWQEKVLIDNKVLLENGKNLLYSVPTSGGKSMIAELSLLRMVKSRNKTGILVLPLISLVEEKLNDLRALCKVLDIEIEGYYGLSGIFPPSNGPKLIVATFEKTIAYLNCLIELDRPEIGLIVIDELHMIGENSHRAQLIENILTKVLFLNTIQIIAMTATISNLSDLGNWLNAQIFQASGRPIPLEEHLVLRKSPTDKNLSLFKILSNPNFSAKKEISSEACNITQIKVSANNRTRFLFNGSIFREAYSEDRSVIVFCGKRSECETQAKLLADVVEEHISIQVPDKVLKHERKLLIKRLNEQDNNLRKALEYGIYFHHAGMKSEARKIVETAYRDKTLGCLCATSTLAAGVNLPCSVVIFQPSESRNLQKSQYLQMSGRAGRMGLDEKGYTYILCDESQFGQMEEMLNSDLTPTVSKWTTNGLEMFILDVVGTSLGNTVKEIWNIFCKSYYYFLMKQEKEPGIFDPETKSHSKQLSVQEFVLSRIEELKNYNLIQVIPNESDCEVDQEKESFSLTLTGQACFNANLTCEQSKFIYREIEKARINGIVFNNNLQILYLITPIDYGYLKMNWNYLRNFKYTGEQTTVLERIGLSKIISSPLEPRDTTLRLQCSRLYNALILQQILANTWNEKFQHKSGDLEKLVLYSGRFAYLMSRFCQSLNYFWLEVLFKRASEMIREHLYGVQDQELKVL